MRPWIVCCVLCAALLVLAGLSIGQTQGPLKDPGATVGKSRKAAETEKKSEDCLMKLYWDTPDDIAEQLLEAHPDVDPLTVRFTDLHRWVTELEGFADDPKASSEGKLEKIQMTWLELYKEQVADD